MSTSRSNKERPAWQLPPGVSRGAWDYVNEPTIATDYDRFHDGHPLLQLDRELVADVAKEIEAKSASSPLLAVDLGCGTGRTLLPILKRGWNVLGVDLSQAMLDTFASKVPTESRSQCALIRGNMAQLEFLNGDLADLVTCLYSSFGMIRGRVHRRATLTHIARTLKLGGKLVIHVHNRGIWIRDPGGLRRMLSDWLRSRRDAEWEYGDRVYAYRGLPSMFLHIFSERELRSDIKHSGLQIETFHRLNLTSSGYLKAQVATHMTAGGFIAIARKQQDKL